MIFQILADLVLLFHASFIGFVEQHLVPLVYPCGLEPRLQIFLGALVLLVNGGLYWYVFRYRRVGARRS